MNEPIRSARDAGLYLESLINTEREPGFRYERMGLEPVRRLLARLGNPERSLSILHIAGSKGKGSTALFAESLLRACGERPATFTSPHLSDWTERFRIDGQPVPGEALARAVAVLRPHVEALRAADPGCAPTFFDATTAAALWLFADAGVDRAILEVGLGGRLDSTNAVQPAVTCITSIELEHTDVLGGTLAAIAAEKAGILKPGIPCVLGLLADPADAVVRERARKRRVPLSCLGRDFRADVAASRDGLGISLHYRETDGWAVEARIPVLGPHQGRNAALAIACLRRLGAGRADTLAADVGRGLASTRLPGRIEVLGREPWLIVDGAHTAASAAALAQALRGLPAADRHLVMSVSAGKDVNAILAALAPGVASLTATRAEAQRSLDPEVLARAMRSHAPGAEIQVVANPELALRAARRRLAAGDLLCAAGSVYLAGIARRIFGATGNSPEPN